MIISFVNGKGGVGKTTVSILMASLYHEIGKKVALRDNDPQKTASKWLDEIRKTDPERTPPMVVDGETYDIVVIDTPPRVESELVSNAVKMSDIICLVATSSPADLWTTRDTVAMVREHLKGGAKACVLFNQVQGGTRLGKEVSTISEQLGLPALVNVLPRSQSVQHAGLYGLLALTAPAREALHKVALELATL